MRYHGNLYGLPEAVRITLWLDANPAARIAGESGTGPGTESPRWSSRPSRG